MTLNWDKLFKFALSSTIISFITSSILGIIAISLYPNFNWFYNSLSHLSSYPEGMNSYIFFNGALLISFFGNILTIIINLNDSIENYNRLEIIGNIFLIISDSMIGFEALFSITFIDLHIYGAQLLLLSLFFALGFYIINYFNKKNKITIFLFYFINFMILLIIWIFFFNLNKINLSINYSIPELFTYIIFYLTLGMIIYKKIFKGKKIKEISLKKNRN
ncbi:MAG: hypothetical protein ACTSPY_04890 [Candidatus Helarchaeota archaeon]